MKKHGDLDHYLIYWSQQKDDAFHATSRPVHEDVEHIFFHCLRFADERKTLQAQFHKQLSPKTTKGMLASRTTWNEVIDYASHMERGGQLRSPHGTRWSTTRPT